MEVLLGVGVMSCASMISSALVFANKNSVCLSHPTFPICPKADSTTTSAPVIGTGSTPAAAASSASSLTSLVTDKRVAPYAMINTKSIGLLGKSKWMTLAFAVGYDNGKIVWDAGAVDMKKLNTAITAAKARGGGVILSFGGATAGTRGTKNFGELAGRITDPQKLADAYTAVAKAVQCTWLDFDVEKDAVKETASVDRRNKAIAILQKSRPDMRVSFTVPVELNGIDADAKSMLTKAKAAGVRIDVVNLMTMYFTSSKTSMSGAVAKAVQAARPFITSLGARIGITPQIGKNPDKPYTYENFTLADAAAVVTSSKPESDVAMLSYWSFNADVTKYKGAYAKAFSGFAS